MDILPVLKGLRRNRAGAVLIGLQIAVTLAIVCNCLSIILQYAQGAGRPSGLDEANIFTFSNQWVGKPTNLAPRIQADLSAIRALPGVTGVQATNSISLHGGGWSWALSLKPDQKGPTSPTTLYFVDEQGLDAYGIKLTAGRWFNADEVGEHAMHDDKFPADVVVTAALAHALYPGGNALGQTVYWTPTAPSRIVGIVERAQNPWAAERFTERESERSAFLPYHYVNSSEIYVVRTRPGQLAAAMQAVPERLYALSRQRVIDELRPFAETRRLAYGSPRATAVLLGALSGLLLAVTIFGITGLTMHWVGQRGRQIGMRRALGARRIDILQYFHTENLLISGVGTLLGIGLGLAGNAWLVTHVAQPRMNIAWAAVGAGVVIVVSQAAVIWPALRAASIPPAVATRGR